MHIIGNQQHVQGSPSGRPLIQNTRDMNVDCDDTTTKSNEAATSSSSAGSDNNIEKLVRETVDQLIKDISKHIDVRGEAPGQPLIAMSNRYYLSRLVKSLGLTTVRGMSIVTLAALARYTIEYYTMGAMENHGVDDSARAHAVDMMAIVTQLLNLSGGVIDECQAAANWTTRAGRGVLCGLHAITLLLAHHTGKTARFAAPIVGAISYTVLRDIMQAFTPLKSSLNSKEVAWQAIWLAAAVYGGCQFGLATILGHVAPHAGANIVNGTQGAFPWRDDAVVSFGIGLGETVDAAVYTLLGLIWQLRVDRPLSEPMRAEENHMIEPIEWSYSCAFPKFQDLVCVLTTMMPSRAAVIMSVLFLSHFIEFMAPDHEFVRNFTVPILMLFGSYWAFVAANQREAGGGRQRAIDDPERQPLLNGAHEDHPGASQSLYQQYV